MVDKIIKKCFNISEQICTTSILKMKTIFLFPGAVLIRLLMRVSLLGEHFKCGFLYLFLYYFNGAVHAYEKQRFS